MKLQEYEAKQILLKYGINIPRGRVARSADEAVHIANELGGPVFVKAQVAVSGRGKAGGILEAKNPPQTAEFASQLLNSKIKDLPVKALLVENKIDSSALYYVSVAVDRGLKCLVALASTQGGGDIEETARSSPQDVVKMAIDPLAGLSPDQAKNLFSPFKLDADTSARLASVLVSLHRIAKELDAELVEINPLMQTGNGFCAADARIVIDDNALFRHPEFNDRNLIREDDTELEKAARRQRLAYVDLDGDIGVLGNGAGLVMATLDTLNYFGGRPANFLDIGGGAPLETVRDSLLFIMARPQVKAVLINILGGITRCDLVAEAIAQALKMAPLKKPLAVRMMGTREAEGREILRQVGVTYFDDMDQAARAAISLGAG